MRAGSLVIVLAVAFTISGCGGGDSTVAVGGSPSGLSLERTCQRLESTSSYVQEKAEDATPHEERLLRADLGAAALRLAAQTRDHELREALRTFGDDLNDMVATNATEQSADGRAATLVIREVCTPFILGHD